LVVEECRRRRIVVPSPGALERLCVQARYQARGEVQRRLTDGLSAGSIVAVGAFADPDFPPPSASIFEATKHAWTLLPEGMKHFQGTMIASS
jgi:hypothetical protein